MTSPSAGREKLLRWYAKQDEVLQLRIRLLACQVAELKGTSTGQELPGACRGAREDRATFDFIADSLVKPLLSCRAREAVTNLSAPGRRRSQLACQWPSGQTWAPCRVQRRLLCP